MASLVHYNILQFCRTIIREFTVAQVFCVKLMCILPHTILIFNTSEPSLFTVYTSITVLLHMYFVKILTKTFLC